MLLYLPKPSCVFKTILTTSFERDDAQSALGATQPPFWRLIELGAAAETTVRGRTACHKRALVTSETPSIVESGRTSPENPEALISREQYAYIVSIMRRTEKDSLGEFEQMVLLAALRLTDQAYAVTIRREIERRTGRSVSRGAVYITLDRLEKKGFLTSYLANSTAERGGRAKRYYQVKPVGEAALKDSWSAMRKMWEGLEPVVRKV